MITSLPSGERGYLGQPTVVNNDVETLAHVPLIIRRSADWYHAHRPTLFSVSGDVARPGVFELPLGIPLGELIGRAGGPPPGDRVQAVLPGGYSLPWLSRDHLDVALAPEALEAAGSGLGASIIVVGARRGSGRAAAQLAAFFARETCETCPICVTGMARMAQLLRPAADRALDVAEGAELTALPAEHRHRGVCTLLDTAANIVLTSVPQLVGDGAAEVLAGWPRGCPYHRPGRVRCRRERRPRPAPGQKDQGLPRDRGPDPRADRYGPNQARRSVALGA